MSAVVADVTPASAGWQFSGLRVVDLDPGGTERIDLGECEAVVIPLRGSVQVTGGAEGCTLAGRADVFSAVSDFAYVPRGTELELCSAAGGRFAVAMAPARRDLPFRHVPATDVRVELRGAGSASRQVNNMCMPDSFAGADRILVCEVLTPGGNWSSFPPHKHDAAVGGESVLEEIYYFEVADGPSGPGVGFQRVYSSDARPIDVCAEVRTGDVVLVPYGWHGPTIAAPGYDLYFLNVMAGPSDERAWCACDDPAHAWIRETWTGQPLDPRLPLATAGGRNDG